jgi:hypothetical protein
MPSLNGAACLAVGRPWLKAVDPWLRQVFYYRPRCNSWYCPACGFYNRDRWSARVGWGIAVLAAEGVDNFNFVTVTLPGYLGVDGTLKRWRKCWPKLSTRIRREVGEKWHYVYVHEQHKDGRLHVHMVSSAQMLTRWYKDNCATSGFGFIADVRPVEDEAEAARYISKYLTKTLNGGSPWPRGWRRISTSRGWPLLPESGQSGYDFEYVPRSVSISAEIARYQRDGFVVRLGGHLGAWEWLNDIKDLGAEIVTFGT